jgi:hypothetical protein
VPFFIKKIYSPALTVPSLPHLTFRTPTKSNLHLANSLPIVVSEPDLYSLLTLQVPDLMHLFHWFGRTKGSFQNRGTCSCFMRKQKVKGLSAPKPNLKLKDLPLSDVRDWLFNIQGVPGGNVNILGGHSIGHSKQKNVYIHVSYSERFPR